MSGPLDGLRVLELATGVAGPYAGRLFAMLGATVVKAEPEGGDPCRSLRIDDEATAGTSPIYIHLNAGKRNVIRESVDLERALRWADIVIDDKVGSDVEGTHTDPAVLGKLRLVLASVTAWGFAAPDAGSPEDELLVQAACGLMTATGEPGREPLRFPGWQSQYMAGAYAASAALASLGEGGFHHVDVSWAGAMITGVEAGVCAYLQRASNPQRTREPEEEGSSPRRGRGAGIQAGAFPAGAFRCADGHVVPGSVRPLDWLLQCEVYGRPDLLEDERFSSASRFANREALVAEIQPWYDSHTKRDIFLRALEAGWAAGMVMTAADAISDPHLSERNFLSPVEGDGGAGSLVPRRPWRARGIVEGEPVRLAERGADDSWFSRELGKPKGHRPIAPPRIPSLKILELTWAWAGPFVGRFLGAMGADVVRVETGRRPDAWRTRVRWKDAGVPMPEGADPDHFTWDAAALFNTLNRNKRGVSVDLAHPDGKDVFLRLVSAADALVVNMGFSVLSDRGVEAEVLGAIEDRGLIVLNMPALGATGPYRAMPGYGMLMEGMGGFSARLGYRDEGARASSTYYPDAVAGIHGTVAVLAALAERDLTGKGAYIDLSQQEVTWLMLGEGIVLRSVEGREPARLGNAEPGFSPSGVYPVSDEGFVALRVGSDDEYGNLVSISAPHLDGMSGLALDERLKRRDEIDEALAGWTKGLDADEVVKRLRAAGVPAQEVITYSRAYREGSLQTSGLSEELVHPVTGNRAYLTIPVRIDGRVLSSSRAAPVFSQHTEEVLAEWAGIGSERFEALEQAEAVGTVPQQRPPRQ